MASAKGNRKLAATAIDLPECPVCLETMTAPIYQCERGHSLCHACTLGLDTQPCPVCRQPMTQVRNRALEDIVAKAQVPCPNKSSGCVYTMLATDLEDHLKQCIFREMACPLGIVFGKCSWSGKLREMVDHFKERHPSDLHPSSETDVDLTGVSASEDDRRVFLTTQGKLHFLLTVKIDTIQKMAYWIIQLIGNKKIAHQHIYEIHVTSNQDPRRKVVFIDHCISDAMKSDDVFRQGKCAALPIEMLAHFIKDGKLSFRYFIKRIPTGPNPNKGEKNEENENPGNKGPGNKGPGFKGPKGPGPKGPGPKGPWRGPKKVNANA